MPAGRPSPWWKGPLHTIHYSGSHCHGLSMSDGRTKPPTSLFNSTTIDWKSFQHCVWFRLKGIDDGFVSISSFVQKIPYWAITWCLIAQCACIDALPNPNSNNSWSVKYAHRKLGLFIWRIITQCGWMADDCSTLLLRIIIFTFHPLLMDPEKSGKNHYQNHFNHLFKQTLPYIRFVWGFSSIDLFIAFRLFYFFDKSRTLTRNIEQKTKTTRNLWKQTKEREWKKKWEPKLIAFLYQHFIDALFHSFLFLVSNMNNAKFINSFLWYDFYIFVVLFSFNFHVCPFSDHNWLQSITEAGNECRPLIYKYFFLFSICSCCILVLGACLLCCLPVCGLPHVHRWILVPRTILLSNRRREPPPIT